MAAKQSTPPLELVLPANGTVRQRVCKACDRCRLKKLKCDGHSPCSRCMAEDVTCVFGHRKKSHNSVYPKGYVELLEFQQAQLVIGLHELYKLVRNGRGWPGSPLKKTKHGTPLTHDILEQLRALEQGEHSTRDASLQYPNVLRQRLIKTGAKQHVGPGVESEVTQSLMFDGNPEYFPFFADPSAVKSCPKTPRDQSPRSRSAAAIPSKMQPYARLRSDQIVMNPAFLHDQDWDQSNALSDDNLTFNSNFECPLSFDSPVSFDNITAFFGQEQVPVGNMKPFNSI